MGESIKKFKKRVVNQSIKSIDYQNYEHVPIGHHQFAIANFFNINIYRTIFHTQKMVYSSVLGFPRIGGLSPI